MRDDLRRVGAVAFALLLLTSGVASPTLSPVGTAAAETREECSMLDNFVYWVTYSSTGSSWVDWAESQCGHSAYVEDAVTEMKQSDANQTRVDIYSAALGVKAGQKAWAAPYDNYLNDTQSVAWMKAQVAIASAYKNGATEVEARAEAYKAIERYYAIKQKNLIAQWNVSLSQYGYLRERAQMEDGIETWQSVHYSQNGDVLAPDDSYHTTGYDLTNESISLVTGNSTGVKALHFNGEITTEGTQSLVARIDGSGDRKYFEGNGNYADLFFTVDSLTAIAPSSEFDNKRVFRFQLFHDRWNKIESMTSSLKSEVQMYVNVTYDDYQSGRINASDVISAHTAMFELGVRSGNKSESLWRSTAALAMLGFETPNLNNSGTMTISYGGDTFHGLVMADEAPNGTWVSGKTYNTSNIDGLVFFLTTDGRKIDTTEGETFTIEKLTAKDGSTIETIQTTQYVYKTANTTELLAMQQQLLELRQEIEEREDQIGWAGGGGGAVESGVTANKAFIALAALAIILVATRN